MASGLVRNWPRGGVNSAVANPGSLFMPHSAVRERMTGLAAIPSTFRLCSVGRQFHTAVLTALAPALAPLEGEDHSVEGGAVGAMGAREFVNPSSDRKDVESDTGAGLVKGRMEVRRLSESQGSLNSPVLGGLSDW